MQVLVGKSITSLFTFRSSGGEKLQLGLKKGPRSFELLLLLPLLVLLPLLPLGDVATYDEPRCFPGICNIKSLS